MKKHRKHDGKQVIDFDYKILENNRMCASKNFHSIFDFLNFNDEHWGNENSTDSSKSWMVGHEPNMTLKKTEEMLIKGCATDDLLALVDKYRDELRLDGLYDIQSNVKSCIRRRVFSDDGDMVNIDRYLTDDMLMWETTRRVGRKSFITLGLDICMSHGNKKDAFARNTALAYCTAEILENLGYGVEIKVTASGEGCFNKAYLENVYGSTFEDIDSYYGEFSVGFTLKHTEEPLNLNAIASTSLVGLFRKYCFNVHETIFGEYDGRAIKPTQEQLEVLDVDIIVSNSWNDANEQKNYVTKAILDLVGSC